jgi:3-deoxy-D-manno-oct-2-ulosonic acid (Kdo) hydroxylase
VTETPTSAEPNAPASILERNELAFWPSCPLAIPPAGELDFLRRQETSAFGQKDVSFDPVRHKLGGQKSAHPSDARRLADLLTQFSDAATAWLTAMYPAYSAGLIRDRVTVRTEEEATRTLRLTARNDLLHIDNFPTRPTFGRRILRLFVNINPTEPRVWATSERFPDLVSRFAAAHRVPARSFAEWTAPAPRMLGLLSGGRQRRSAYDGWMLRLHHFLKEDQAFQMQAARKMWSFPPGSMWLLFSDGLAHAQLRGRFALEHSFFVPQECLELPEESPLGVLLASGRQAIARRAG